MPVDLGREGLESSLVGMGLAGEGEAQQGAAVEGVFEAHDCGTLGVGARDLDGVFDGLSASVDQQSFLGKRAGRDGVQLLGERDVVLVRRDLGASV